MHGHADDMKSDSTKNRQGLVIVITGDGKGKTTSALGQALRALGHERKVLLIQFLKQGCFGETEALSRFPNIDIKQFGRAVFVDPQNPQPIDYEYAQQGMKTAIEAMTSLEYDLVILDEINVAVHFGLITVDEVTQLIKNRRPEIDLVLTGRYAASQLIDLADTVSEIRNVKHHFEQGTKARDGIEF